MNKEITHIELVTWEELYRQCTADLRLLAERKERSKRYIQQQVKGLEKYQVNTDQLSEKDWLQGELRVENRELATIYKALSTMDQLMDVYHLYYLQLHDQYSKDIQRLMRENDRLKKDLVLFRQMSEDQTKQEEKYCELLIEAYRKISEQKNTKTKL